MNIKFNFQNTVLMAVLLFFSACQSNDEATQPLPQQPAGQLKKISLSDGSSSSFEYNSKGLLSKRIDVLEDGQTESSLFEYDSKNRLSKIIYADADDQNQEVRFQYAVDAFGNEVLKKREVFVENQKLSSTEFFFSQEKKLTQQREYIVLGEEEEELTYKITYEYHPAGNLHLEKYFQTEQGNDDFVLIRTVTYEQYDDKTLPYSFLELFPFIPGTELMKNNPLKIKSVGEPSEEDYTQEFEYSYDEKGRPKTFKLEFQGETSFELQGTLEYY